MKNTKDVLDTYSYIFGSIYGVPEGSKDPEFVLAETFNIKDVTFEKPNYDLDKAEEVFMRLVEEIEGVQANIKYAREVIGAIPSKIVKLFDKKIEKLTSDIMLLATNTVIED